MDKEVDLDDVEEVTQKDRDWNALDLIMYARHIEQPLLVVDGPMAHVYTPPHLEAQDSAMYPSITCIQKGDIRHWTAANYVEVLRPNIYAAKLTNIEMEAR